MVMKASEILRKAWEGVDSPAPKTVLNPPRAVTIEKQHEVRIEALENKLVMMEATIHQLKKSLNQVAGGVGMFGMCE
jgi:hypothetical protein